jgi:hypothetical protein
MFRRAIPGASVAEESQHGQRSVVSVPQWEANLRVLQVMEIKIVL